MIETFATLHPVQQAPVATCFTWGMTTRGAAAVFLAKEVRRDLLNTILGFSILMTLDVAPGSRPR